MADFGRCEHGALPDVCFKCAYKSGLLLSRELTERVKPMTDAVDEVASRVITLRAALATALADRDAHVRGYEDMEQRHAAVVAERDQMRRERDEAREGWKEPAAQFARNADFYRGLVTQIGEMFGEAARTSDDGSVQDSVLALKVPELVRQALRERNEAREDAAEDAGDYEKMLGEVRAERDALRAAIEPTDENLALYDKAMRSKFHSSRPSDMARAVLAAIAARAGKP